jgi:hypothetical protein
MKTIIHNDDSICKVTSPVFCFFAASVVDRGFIGGVMVSMLTTSVVDRGFISGVMVSMLTASVVDRGFEPWSG